MASAGTQIKVNPLADNPTKLWEKLSVKQNQKKLTLNDYTKNVTERKTDHVRFVLISDTHSQTDDLKLPEGDVLLHAGDFTRRGKPAEVEKFNNFLGSVKDNFKHIIVICGNHELTFDPNGAASFEDLLDDECKGINHRDMKNLLTNCRYIEDETVEVMGFKIYGSPWQPEFGGWAYNLTRGEECLEKWNLIPDDTDIVMTHGPPLGYGDSCFSKTRAGCSELLATIQQRVKPLLHVFGHIHEAYGVWTDGTTTYVNASTCTLFYKAVQPPIVIDLKPTAS